MEKFLPLKIQKQIGKNILAIFDGKKSVINNYHTYEDNFLKEANRVILIDDGQPQLMQTISKEFIQILQGAMILIHEDPKKSSVTNRINNT